MQSHRSSISGFRQCAYHATLERVNDTAEYVRCIDGSVSAVTSSVQGGLQLTVKPFDHANGCRKNGGCVVMAFETHEIFQPGKDMFLKLLSA